MIQAVQLLEKMQRELVSHADQDETASGTGRSSAVPPATSLPAAPAPFPPLAGLEETARDPARREAEQATRALELAFHAGTDLGGNGLE
jgi:hypothetical protein